MSAAALLRTVVVALLSAALQRDEAARGVAAEALRQAEGARLDGELVGVLREALGLL